MASIATRLGPADHGRRMSLEAFQDADVEDGFRYELARGVLEVTEVPNDPHGVLICNLYDALALYRHAHPGVIHRYGGGGEFRLWLPGMASGRNPDIAVVLHGTPRDSRGRRPPSLVMEVVSEGSETRDYETKRNEYLIYGLREYWIVDRDARRILVLIRDGDVWIEHVFHDGQTAEGLVLPGFAVSVADLWQGTDD